MKKSILAAFLLLLANSCDKCNEGEPGPPRFIVNLIDADTGENLFLNGTFAQAQIEVLSDDSDSEYHSFLGPDILLISPAWESGTFHLVIKIADQAEIPIEAEVVRIPNECNDFYQINNLIIEGFDSNFDVETGYYNIEI